MRIISQNRMVDVPYERVTIVLEVKIPLVGGVYAIVAYVAGDKQNFILGQYENQEQAFCEMEMIRAKYAERCPVYLVRKEGI